MVRMCIIEIRTVDEMTRNNTVCSHHTCSDVSILHHAINSKNFETVSVIVRQLNENKDLEMNREVSIHRWTPLYRAGNAF